MASIQENGAPPEAPSGRLADKALKIGRLSAIYALGQTLPLLVGVFLLPVFTHYLVPEQMGIVTLALQIMGPMTVIAQFGLWSGLRSHYFRIDESLRGRYVRTALFGQLFQASTLCVILSFAGLWLADILLPNLPLHSSYIFPLWLMIVWTGFFVSLVQFATGLPQLLEQAGVSVAIPMARYLMQASFGVVAVVCLGWQGFGRFGTISLAAFLAAVLSVYVLWNRGEGGFDFSIYRRTLRTGITFVPHAMSECLLPAISAWLLSSQVSVEVLGTFAIAAAFPQLINMPLMSFGNAAYPTLAHLMAEGGHEAKRQQCRLYTLLIALVVVATLAVGMIAPVAIVVLTATKYHPATEIVWILVVGCLFQGLYQVVAKPLFYFGHGLQLSTASFLSMVIGVILALTLIPKFHGLWPQWAMAGAAGAAFAIMGRSLALAIMTTVATCRIYRLPWQVSAALRIFLCAGALAAVDALLWPAAEIRYLPVGSLAWIVLFKGTLLLSIVPALWLTGVVSTSDFRRASRALRRKLSAMKNPKD